MAFSFLEYLFRFRDIHAFVLCKWGKWWRHRWFHCKYNTQIIFLEILKQCSLNLAPEMYITKETKWHLTCRCHGNSYPVGPVLIKAKIPRLCLKTWVIHSQQTNGESIDDMRTMCAPRKTLCATCKCCKWRYLLFHRKRLEPRVLPWQHHSKWHFVSFVMYFSGAKFEENSSKFLEIFLIQYFTVQV